MLGKDIRVRTIKLPFNERQQGRDEVKISERNKLAIQSAIIRGDTSVTLYNWDGIPMQIWPDIQGHLSEIDRVEIQHFDIFGPSGPKDPHGLLANDVQDTVEYETWAGLDFRFDKILAQGGHGFVSLWDVTFDDRSSRKVVIKKGVSSCFSAESEMEFHLRYNRAEHTTQVVDLHREAQKIQAEMRKADPLARRQFSRGAEWNAKKLNCAVFEYAPYGDVYRFMENVREKKAQFTNQVLWGIWECFVMGMATIAYTPSLTHLKLSFEQEFERARSQDKLWDFLNHIEQSWRIEHDVHLDMEALNVLVGTCLSHTAQPVFKIHDLGAWSFSMSTLWKKMKERDVWRMRGPVKLHGLTPEQMSREWDDIPLRMKGEDVQQNFAGEDFKKGSICAGRFGMWTNIFLIARVMESIMTGVFARYPFQCGPHMNRHGRAATQTYGWQLMDPEYSHIDEELRGIICRCLNERPQDRPTVVQLIRDVERRKAKGFSQPEEAVKKWWTDLLHPNEELRLPAQRKSKASPVKQAVADQMGPSSLIQRAIRDPAARVRKSVKVQATGHGKQPRAGASKSKAPQRRRSGDKDQGDAVPNPRRADGLVRPIRGRGKVPQVEPHKGDPITSRSPSAGFVNQKAKRSIRPGIEIRASPPYPDSRPYFSAVGRNSPPAFLENRAFGKAPSPAGQYGSGSADSYGPPATAIRTRDSSSMNIDDEDGLRDLQQAAIDKFWARRLRKTSPAPTARNDDPYNPQQPAAKPNSPWWPPTHALPTTRPRAKVRESSKSPQFKSVSISRVTQSTARHVRFDTNTKPVVTSKISKWPAKDKKGGYKTGPKKSKVLESWVKKALPVMPVAIQNLVTRARHLNEQLRDGDVPIYAYIK
ncbi:hypothetical protein QYS62_000292 [Fusarium acuminatum]|uniref:Protein kinase domain-containing protein n=1 Tax=Fusarium acuminatum TaxID=5515 RepID=A0ABZ2WGH8_9HYPO